MVWGVSGLGTALGFRSRFRLQWEKLTCNQVINCGPFQLYSHGENAHVPPYAALEPKP